MTEQLRGFKKRNHFLICVDSDGCAMDSMDIKHIRCFGPCMVDEWGLGKWRDEILKRWNEINLYTMTRGINRFQGLAKALREIQEKYCEIEGLDDLERWVKDTKELSNEALEHVITETGSICLRRALAWSRKVNQSVGQLDRAEIRPFDGVREALGQAHDKADIAVVSSANRGAVLEEWEKHGLLEYTDIVLTQDFGNKAFCIGELMKQGYGNEHVLMCGDALGDLEAARINGVCYYPILVRHETESWREFASEGLVHFLNGTFKGAYQEKKNEQFLKNLQVE